VNINHNGTITKIRALYGKRLRPEHYNEVASQRRVSDITEFLRTLPSYAYKLEGLDSNTIHRGMLEDILRRSVFEVYFKIIGFEHLEKEPFYNYKILQAEIREILTSIQHINAKSNQHIEKLPVYLDRFVSFSLLELAKARTRDDLLEVLNKTPYRALIENIPLRKSGRIDFNPTEKALRNYYYNTLLGSPYFKQKESSALKSLITTDIDLINVINAYRLVGYFGESASDVENILLPFTGKLRGGALREIYSAGDRHEFVDRFRNSYYGRVMENYGIVPSQTLELETQRLRYQYAKHALQASVSPVMSVYSYMFLYETEVNNLVTAIEAIRYGLSENEILPLLVL
jgi:V/A-type H+-transporting ATPase subunit C